MGPAFQVPPATPNPAPQQQKKRERPLGELQLLEGVHKTGRELCEIGCTLGVFLRSPVHSRVYGQPEDWTGRRTRGFSRRVHEAVPETDVESCGCN